MVLTCEEGHEIDPDTNKCSQGHPAAQAAGGEVPILLTNKQLQDVITSAVTGALKVQQNALQPPQQSSKSTLRKHDRPKIDLTNNEGHWAFFIDEWCRYKRQSKINATDINDELRSCCAEQLRKELFDLYGAETLDTLDEDGLLDKIKRVAIKGKNKSVHRQEFYGMSQVHDQPVQAYVAQLRCKAEHCRFTVKCTSEACEHHVNSYAESMVSDQMVVGCSDSDIQQEALAKDSLLHTFQEKFDLIQALEEGRRAKSQLTPATTIAAAHKSQYKKQQVQQKVSLNSDKGNNDLQHQCSGCGSKEHG